MHDERLKEVREMARKCLESNTTAAAKPKKHHHHHNNEPAKAKPVEESKVAPKEAKGEPAEQGTEAETTTGSMAKKLRELEERKRTMLGQLAASRKTEYVWMLIAVAVLFAASYIGYTFYSRYSID